MKKQTHARFEDSRKGALKSLIMLLLCLAIVFSLGSVPVFAGETAFDIDLSTAAEVGNVTLKTTTYPLYRIAVDGKTYSSIRVKRTTGKIDVNGVSQQFPTTAHTGDTGSSIGPLNTDGSKTVIIKANDNNFKAAKTYYTDKTTASGITFDAGVT